MSSDFDTTNNNLGGAMLGCSFASDFTHDNSDYQWFDYGYRDGVQHHSILSSLSASYGVGDLSYYDDMAKNIDVNLALVDIDDFRREDINSLLRIEQRTINNSTMKLILKDPTEFENSICKSKLLFSPVKETHISIDSLDMDGYPDDIILTCKANKNNYTIAFDGMYGSLYSDDSYYDIPDHGKPENIVLIKNILKTKGRKPDITNMTQSEAGYTTWGQLNTSNDAIQMQRYPSGNNNNVNTEAINTCDHHYMNCSIRKCSSMPNLKEIPQRQQTLTTQLNVSEVVESSNQSSFNRTNGNKILLPMLANAEIPTHPDNSNSNNEKADVPSFNLVKLFMKQKSASSDTCMDVSSGCWPSDSTNSSTEHPEGRPNSNINRTWKKSMNDSGKCSTLTRHEEDAEYELDSLDTHAMERNDSNRDIFDSPVHRKRYKECSLNIQMRKPKLFDLMSNNNSCKSSNNNNSQSDTSRTSENLTQIFKKQNEDSRVTVPIDMITKSIQTSSVFMQQADKNAAPKSFVKMVPPSFLSQLSKLGDSQQAPVYVIYPNYTLPDLEFMNNQSLKLDKDIIISPMGYQRHPRMAATLNLKSRKPIPSKPRPMSLNFEKPHQAQYNHVQDWASLLTLLPGDYRKLLKNIPEVSRISMEASQKPLFCMTPPIRRTVGLYCDCQTLLQNQAANSSGSNGSSQPPSSGYRGSSTMLTDSEIEGIATDIFENTSTRNITADKNDKYPVKPEGSRGILRRNNTTTNALPNTPTSDVKKPKRHSMIEQPKSPMQQQKNPMKLNSHQEKRKSLQEVNFNHNGLEEYFNNIGGVRNFANRLPNYMKARDNLGDFEKNYNQIVTELELNKALSNKFYQPHEAKAEAFLDNSPQSLKMYAEISNIINWQDIDRKELRNEISRTLSQKKVAFNNDTPSNHVALRNPNLDKKFTTPPNSPQQMSQVVGITEQKMKKIEKEKEDKIQSNRFKRLQIQWELLSNEKQNKVFETKSGNTTPTGASKNQSKIPRPVSYPNSKAQNLRSPNAISTTPKKHAAIPSSQTIPSPTAGVKRTKLHSTPKKSLPARPSTRTR